MEAHLFHCQMVNGSGRVINWPLSDWGTLASALDAEGLHCAGMSVRLTASVSKRSGPATLRRFRAVVLIAVLLTLREPPEAGNATGGAAGCTMQA